jgi:hypothetical protein
MNGPRRAVPSDHETVLGGALGLHAGAAHTLVVGFSLFTMYNVHNSAARQARKRPTHDLPAQPKLCQN